MVEQCPLRHTPFDPWHKVLCRLSKMYSPGPNFQNQAAALRSIGEMIRFDRVSGRVQSSAPFFLTCGDFCSVSRPKGHMQCCNCDPKELFYKMLNMPMQRSYDDDNDDASSTNDNATTQGRE